MAGVFFLTALFFVLIGCAWLLYYELPIGNEFTYFWGFFAMAVILVVLGVIAGLLAAKVVKSGSPPAPDDGDRGGAQDSRDRELVLLGYRSSRRGLRDSCRAGAIPQLPRP